MEVFHVPTGLFMSVMYVSTEVKQAYIFNYEQLVNTEIPIFFI